MAEDIPSAVIAIHNRMVLHLSKRISGQEFCDLKGLFQDNPLTRVDIDTIEDVQTLFRRLKNELLINYGDYNKFVLNLDSIGRKDLCEFVDKCTEDIRRILQQEDTKCPVISMDRSIYHASEESVAFITCTVNDPIPDSVTWKKGDRSPPPSTQILIDNRKFFSGSPAAPSLVIKEPIKTIDEAHYQCSAKARSKRKDGDIVYLKVSVEGEKDASSTRSVPLNDDPSDRGSPNEGGHAMGQQQKESNKGNTCGGRQSRSRSFSSARESKLFTKNRLRQKRSHSYPTTELNLRLFEKQANDAHVDKGSKLSFVIKNEIDQGKPVIENDILKEFAAVTNENGRVRRVTIKPECMRLCIEITAARDQSEPSSVYLAEKFKYFILDGGKIQLSEESRTNLDIDEASFRITPQDACQDGPPYVNISHRNFTVPLGGSAILQTCIIAPPGVSSIRWFKIERDQQIAIEIDNKKYFGGSYRSPTLIIRNANIDDQGLYLCWATNDFGTGSSNISLLSIQSVNERAYRDEKTVSERAQDIKGRDTKTWYDQTSATITANDLDADLRMGGRTQASTDRKDDTSRKRSKPYTKTPSYRGYRSSRDEQDRDTERTTAFGDWTVSNVGQERRESSKKQVANRQDDDCRSTTVEQASSGSWDVKDMYDACESGDKEKCFTIHEKFPAFLTQNSGPCLLLIAESGNTDCYIAVESLLLEGKGEEERQQYIANIVDADKESILHKACRSGKRDMYSYLCNTYPSLVASTDKSSLLQLTFELNKADIMSLLLPSVKDENDIGKCLTLYPLDDRCKQAVALELKQRLADKLKLQGPYRIEPTFNSEGEVVLLTYGLNVVREGKDQFAGMQVLYRNPKQVDNEAIRIANSEKMKTLDRNNIKGKEYAEKAIQAKGTSLMEAHSNINALGVSHLRSRERGKYLETAEKTLVVIYCSSKGFRPIQEDIFPSQLLVDGVVVLIDVREGIFEIAPRNYSAIPSSYFHPKLKMGCECEVEDNGKKRGGTIGPFVKIKSKKDGDLGGFLTCAHVAYGLVDSEDSYSYDEINTPTQLQVYQPALNTFPNSQPSITYDSRCGRTYRGIFGNTEDGVTLDAAVVAVQKDRMPSGGEFAVLRPNNLREIGFTTFPVFNSAEQATTIKDEEIVKFGASTHATKGNYESTVHVREHVSFKITEPTGSEKRPFNLKGQLEISSCTANTHFFAVGDSGSGVFVKRGDDLQCLGLAIGCLSNGSAVVTPIEPILKALGVELMSFTEHMDESQ